MAVADVDVMNSAPSTRQDQTSAQAEASPVVPRETAPIPPLIPPSVRASAGLRSPVGRTTPGWPWLRKREILVLVTSNDIKSKRKAAGLSQAGLAERVGVTQG